MNHTINPFNRTPATDCTGARIDVGCRVRVHPTRPEGARSWLGVVMAVDVEQALGPKLIAVKPNERGLTREVLEVRAEICEVIERSASN